MVREVVVDHNIRSPNSHDGGLGTAIGIGILFDRRGLLAKAVSRIISNVSMIEKTIICISS